MSAFKEKSSLLISSKTSSFSPVHLKNASIPDLPKLDALEKANNAAPTAPKICP